MGYLDGFKIPIKQMGKRQRVTVPYPQQKAPQAERRHGRHVLNRYEDGMEKCIGCELCAGVCPARCIYVRGADNDDVDPVSPGERYGFIYEINYLRCIHCDLCVEACPTEAITETKLFEFSFTNRQDAIYTKAELVVDDAGRPQHLPWEDWRPGEDQHTSAWMRATSPSGSAAYEGRVSWSGELGYGVREPELGQTHEDDLPVAATDPDPVVGQHGGVEHAPESPDDGSGGTEVETAIFIVCAAIVMTGAFGVVLSRNPVHSALSLVATLFGIAVLFLNLDAQLLAAVQVIVYTGAIVVLILFVLMLLGVDQEEDLSIDPIVGQRVLAMLAGFALLGSLLAIIIGQRANLVTGQLSATAAIRDDLSNIAQLGRQLFTTWIFAFEITAGLLTVAVIGAVVMARRPSSYEPMPEPESFDDDGYVPEEVEA